MIQLVGLYLYPVKGLRGISVDRAEVDALGLVGDRRFLIVDENGRFLTQRTLPLMARVNSALTSEHLTLSADGAGSITIARRPNPDAPLRTVTVWSSAGLQAEDCGEAAAAWLRAFLGVRCRLVRIGSAFERPILKAGKAEPGDRVNFADGYPFLIVSEASLANLNDRLVERGAEPVPMNRFRPNFVVQGCGAFAEDTWPRFTIGNVLFRAGGPCGRCAVTTTDQVTGERGLEPLRTLGEYRRNAADRTSVDFGQNLIHVTKSGSVRVGDEVRLVPDL